MKKGVNLKLRSIILLLLLLLTAKILAYEIQVPNMPAGMCFKDMNSDGFVDIIVGHRTTWGSTSPNISILVNDGYGRFSVADSSITSCGYQDYPILQDINNDGDTDLVTESIDFSTGVIDRFFRIYTNFRLGIHPYIDYPLQRNGTIDKWICFPAPDRSHYLSFVCNQDSYWGYIHLSESGQLLNQVYYDLLNYPQDINYTDIDNDGYFDVIIQYPHAVSLWKGYSNGFDQLNISGQVLVQGGLFADMDNNGSSEYVTLYKMLLPYTVISVYSINVTTVTQQYYFFVDQTAIYPQTGDLNNDGYPDLVYNSSFYAPLHNTDISFTWVIKNIAGILDSIPIAYYTGYSSYMSYIADVNNDGWNDIVTSVRSVPSKINILYNDYTGHFIEDSPTVTEDNYASIPNIEISCFPNPFRESTNINFKTKTPLYNPKLEIYNIKGQRIKSIELQKSNTRENTILWDGTDNNHRKVSAGIYFLKMVSDKTQSRLMKCIKY